MDDFSKMLPECKECIIGFWGGFFGFRELYLSWANPDSLMSCSMINTQLLNEIISQYVQYI